MAQNKEHSSLEDMGDANSGRVEEGSSAVLEIFRYIKVSAVPDAATPAPATLLINDLGDFVQLESRGGCVFQNKHSNLQGNGHQKGCHGYF